ncbi:hypothetical protein [Actinacidiphila acididurans]|uniref:Zinc ribbon domain-containing protein n=1 Tax=Actinacidiphila acididurans TaxID=2784346 RepID=A0ABS2TR96_9ACTN|nr:hypothetical protein [Actinacidiphila acididurans]MBM9505869.1 hypothetical protein [Actinacidiphila acididurans]
MSHCTYCGAPFADAHTRFCTRCGQPRVDEPGLHQPGYLTVGSTALPVWLLALVVVLLAGGGTAAYFLASSSGHGHSSASSPAPDESQPSDPAGGALPGDSPSDTPTDTDVFTDTPTDTFTDTPTDTPATTDTTTAPTDPADVVRAYYDDINAQDFQAAWDLGGRNIGGSSYSAWVDGFSTTQDVRVDATDDPSSSDLVDVSVTADQTDGTVKNFSGTYTVTDGMIVDASIHLD